MTTTDTLSIIAIALSVFSPFAGMLLSMLVFRSLTEWRLKALERETQDQSKKLETLTGTIARLVTLMENRK